MNENKSNTIFNQVESLQSEYFDGESMLACQVSSTDLFADAWQKVCQQTEKVPCDYVYSTLRYHLAYLRGTDGATEVNDYSLVIYSQQNPIAIWPLNLYKTNGQWQLQSHCKGIIPPLIKSGLGSKQTKRVLQTCIAFLNDCMALDELATIKSQFDPCQDTSWQRLLSPSIKKIDYQQQLYLDLTPTLSELKSSFRKSYKSLINQGTKLFKPELLTAMTDNQLEQMRAFHIKVAGRETRSQESWKLQQFMVNNKDAFAVFLYDEQNQLVAAALFNISKGTCIGSAMYSVGIYQRELFELPLGHTTQMVAINYMKELNLSEYFIGYRHHEFEYSVPSQKESSIGFFKEGFSNQVKVEAVATLG